MKKVIVVQIEKVVRETWIVDSEETAQVILDNEKDNSSWRKFLTKGNRNYVKEGRRVVSAEIYSQETKEVEFAPWDGYEK